MGQPGGGVIPDAAAAVAPAAPLQQNQRVSDEEATKAGHAGRFWRHLGGWTILLGVALVIIGVLTIVIMTSSLGNKIAESSDTGLKMMNYIKLHNNEFLLAGLSSTALGLLVLVPLGILSLRYGFHKRTEAIKHAGAHEHID